MRDSKGVKKLFGNCYGANPGFLQGPSQREDIDLFCPGFQQDFRAFLDRRAGGKDVVNQKDMSFGDCLACADLECAADIFLPFRARELSLGFRVARALEGNEI